MEHFSYLLFRLFQHTFAQTTCEPVRDTVDLWASCQGLVSFNQYYEQCVSDICSVKVLSNVEPSCIILAVVAHECALAGAIIDDWADHPSLGGKCGRSFFFFFDDFRNEKGKIFHKHLQMKN